MEPTPAPSQPPPSATTYPDSIDSSPRSRNSDSWGEDSSLYPSNHGSSATAAALGLSKLRLMCSYGGHIVPRPHDKSLCYVGGDTRIVVVDRHTNLVDLTHRLFKTLLRSSSSSTASSLTLKYQLPSEDLDSLISVTTDEDLENMIEEYDRLNSSSAVNKSSRLRLFIFPKKPESDSSIGSLLENSTKSEDWFVNALYGTSSGFSDTSSVNCLLGLDDDVSVPEKKDVNYKGVVGTNLRGNNSGQDVHSVSDSPMMETASSFGSASSTPSLANLPPIRVNVDDHPKVVGGGLEEQFSQMKVQKLQNKHQDDGGFVAAPAPVVVSRSPVSSATANLEHPNRGFSDDERSEQGAYMAYRKHHQQQQQQQFQQKQSTGFDLASTDSVLSDDTTNNPQKPPMTYQDPNVQIQSSNNNYRAADPNSTPDQNTRIQIQQQQQQQQQIQDSACLISMTTTQVDAQLPQLHHQQPQFIHTAVPPPQYIHHHPSGAVPLASYNQMYQSHGQHHPHHLAMDQQNFVYYMPARQPSQAYNFPLQQQQPSYADASPATTTPPPDNQPAPSGTRTAQTALKSELLAGVYRTTNSGAPQFVQVPSSQQYQPQYVGYSKIHHPSQSVASSAPGGGVNYVNEFADSSRRGHHIYHAAQPLPPQSAAQYQTTLTSPVDARSHLPTDNNMKQQQQVRTAQP